MSIKVLYLPKNFYTSPKQISGYAPALTADEILQCHCRAGESWPAECSKAAVKRLVKTRRANLEVSGVASTVNTGVTWSHRRVPVTSRAAAFSRQTGGARADCL